MIKKFQYDDDNLVQLTFEGLCDDSGCKGGLWFHDSDCRFYCEAFAEAYKENAREAAGVTNEPS